MLVKKVEKKSSVPYLTKLFKLQNKKHQIAQTGSQSNPPRELTFQLSFIFNFIIGMVLFLEHYAFPNACMERQGGLQASLTSIDNVESGNSIEGKAWVGCKALCREDRRCEKVQPGQVVHLA